jgi:hypothetical protein
MQINIITFTFDERDFCIYAPTGYTDAVNRRQVQEAIIEGYETLRNTVGPIGPDDTVNWDAFSRLPANAQQSCLCVLLALDILSRDSKGCWGVFMGTSHRGPYTTSSVYNSKAQSELALYFKRKVDAVGFVASVLWAESNSGRLKIVHSSSGAVTRS